jgi:hypothetical protein
MNFAQVYFLATPVLKTSDEQIEDEASWMVTYFGVGKAPEEWVMDIKKGLASVAVLVLEITSVDRE